MAANTEITVASPSADKQAIAFRAKFDDKTMFPFSIVPTIHHGWGADPSYAMVEIGIRGSSKDVSAVQLTSAPPEDIKLGAPACIEAVYSGNAFLNLCGVVTDIDPDAKKDSLIVTISDARHFLRGLALMGSYWAELDASGNTQIVYRQGWSSIVNEDGTPNMTKASPASGEPLVPVFCPPYWNILPGGTVLSGSEVSTASTEAHFWTVPDVLEYIWFAFSARAQSLASATWAWYPWTDSRFGWQQSYANGINSTRNAKERALDGTNVAQLIQDLCMEAGGYALSVGNKTSEDGQGAVSYSNEVIIVKTKYTGGGISIDRPTSGPIEMNDAPTMVGGVLSESAQNLFTQAAILGKRAYIERRIYTNGTGSTAATGLRRAYDSDLDAFRTYASARKADGETEAVAIKQALENYPGVGSAFRVDPAFDFQVGTSLADYPRGKVSRPILSTLLSSYVEDPNLNATITERTRYRRPLPLEYKLPGSSTWLWWTGPNGLYVDADGIFGFDGLPAAIGTSFYDATWSGDDLTAISFADIRVTVAIPCDHAVTGVKKIPNDSDDHARIHASYARTYVGKDAAARYDERKGSYPQPESAGGVSGTYADGILQDDTDRLTEQAVAKLKEYGRTDTGGYIELAFPDLSIKPGASIAKIIQTSGDYPLRRVVSAVDIVTTPNAQAMRLRIG